MKITALILALALASCAHKPSFELTFRKDKGSNLTILFHGPHSGVVTRAAKGYPVGFVGNQWELVTDDSVWTTPD